MRRALLLALLTACQEPATPAAPANLPPGATQAAPAAANPAPVTVPAVSARAACVDAQLGARHLNLYGDPPDTVYAGGSPLFDEKTSATRDRIQYVVAKHPEIERACAAK